MTTWLAVAWATIGVIKTRLNRMVTWTCELPEAGLTALHDPLAIAAYSPPGALGGGVLSTPPGGHGAETGAPSIWPLTALSTSVSVGSWLEARTATRAPSRAAWLSVS